GYLGVPLASIAPQAAAAGAELLVVDDGGLSAGTRAVAARFGASYAPHPCPLGLNAARNTGVAQSGGELVVFVDDDVRVDPGWLGALLQGAAPTPELSEGARADHRAGPRRRRHDRALRLGSQHGDPPGGAAAHRAVRHLDRARRRRAGVAGKAGAPGGGPRGPSA